MITSLMRSHRVFPVLLIGLTALLTLWLDQISRWEPNKRELDPNKPEFVAENFTATRFSPEGSLQDRLVASRMWQYPGKADVYFDQPDMRVYQQGILQYQAVGDSGRYNNKTKQAFFDRKVTLIRPASAQGPETRVLTSAMHVDTQQRIAKSQAPSTIHYGKSVANSVGFVYEQQAGQLNLLSHAKVIYEP